MRKFTFVIGLFLSLIATSAARSILVGPTSPLSQGNNIYKTYSNSRFNYSISYPANLLIAQGESANSDGQVFRAKDGSAEMRVYGQYNVNHETLSGKFSEVTRERADGVT